MAGSLSIVLSVARGDYEKSCLAASKRTATAITAAMRSLGAELKTQARAQIRAAGFSSRWANALRVDIYPKKGVALNPAIYLYHKINYSAVFDEGAYIHGKPYLWVPLKTAPKMVRGHKVTPKLFAEWFGPLVFIPGKNHPLLGSYYGTKGTKGKKLKVLFYGIPFSRIPAKFHIHKMCEATRGKIAGEYATRFNQMGS